MTACTYDRKSQNSNNCHRPPGIVRLARSMISAAVFRRLEVVHAMLGGLLNDRLLGYRLEGVVMA
jgi:hypothetical protein